MEPFADLFWLSALLVRTYIGLRRIAGNLFLYVLLYNTNLLNKLKFNTFFKKLLTNNSLTVQLFFIVQNYPTVHSEERLANLVRGRECFVGLSILYIISLCTRSFVDGVYTMSSFLLHVLEFCRRMAEPWPESFPPSHPSFWVSRALPCTLHI